MNLFRRILFGFGSLQILPTLLLFFFFQFSGTAQNFLSRRLYIPTAEIEELFAFTSGTSVRINAVDENQLRVLLSGKLYFTSKSKQGSENLTANLFAGKQRIHLSLSRRLKEGKFEYFILLAPFGESEVFRLQARTQQEFVLVRKEKPEMVLK